MPLEFPQIPFGSSYNPPTDLQVEPVERGIEATWGPPIDSSAPDSYDPQVSIYPPTHTGNRQWSVMTYTSRPSGGGTSIRKWSSGSVPNTVYVRVRAGWNSPPDTYSEYTAEVQQNPGTVKTYPPAIPLTSNHVDAGIQEVVIDWTTALEDPTWDNPGAISHFDIQYGHWAGSDYSGYTSIDDIGEEVRSRTITGLDGGTEYGIRIRAASPDGDGPWSSVVRFTPDSVPPPPPPADPENRVPGTPLNFSASRNAQQTTVTLTWNKPWEPSAAPITNYNIELQDTDSFGTITPTDPGAGDTSATVSVSASLDYGITINAENTVGTSANASTTSQASQFCDKPAAPTMVGASGNSTTTIGASWTPNSNGEDNCPMLGYRARYRVDGTTSTWVEIGENLVGNRTSYTFSGLAPSTTYNIAVRARNKPTTEANAWSDWSSYITASTNDLPIGALAPPSNLQLTGGNRSISFSFEPAEEATQWQVSYKLRAYISYTYEEWETHSSSPVTNGLLGLSAFQVYDVRVRNRDATRTSDYISGSVTTTGDSDDAPPAPSVGYINVSDSQATITVINEESVTMNQAEISTTSGSGYTTVGSGTGTHFTATGLTAETTYYIRGRSRNSVGWGSYSSDATFTTTASADVPDAPGRVVVSQLGVTTCTVSWERPDDNGASIIRYEARHQLSGQSSYTTIKGTTDNFKQTVVDVTGLTANSSYTVFVRAVNSAGNSAWSQKAFTTLNTGQLSFDRSHLFDDTGFRGPLYQSRTGISETLESMDVRYDICTEVHGYLFAAGCFTPDDGYSPNLVLRSKKEQFGVFDWSTDRLMVNHPPTAFAEYECDLIMFEEGYTYLVDYERMTIRDECVGIGCSSPRSQTVTDRGIFFANHQNFFWGGPQGIVPIGSDVWNIIDEPDAGYSRHSRNHPVIVLYDVKRDAAIFLYYNNIIKQARGWMFSPMKRQWIGHLRFGADSSPLLGGWQDFKGFVYGTTDNQVYRLYNGPGKMPWKLVTSQIKFNTERYYVYDLKITFTDTKPITRSNYRKFKVFMKLDGNPWREIPYQRNDLSGDDWLNANYISGTNILRLRLPRRTPIHHSQYRFECASGIYTGNGDTDVNTFNVEDINLQVRKLIR